MAAGDTTGRTVSIVSRSEKTTLDSIVRSDLMGSSARIPRKHITLYDERGDPIEPPMDVALGRTPITVVVEVPEGTPQGRYRGLLSVYAEDIESSLVLTVVVKAKST